jgi:uncharacterized protein DUF5696
MAIAADSYPPGPYFMKIIASKPLLDWKKSLFLLLFGAYISLSAHAGTTSTSTITPTSSGFTIQITSGSEVLQYRWQAPALGSLYSFGSVSVTDSIDGGSPQAEITLPSKIDWVGPSKGLQSVSIDPGSARATLTFANSSGVMHLSVAPVVDGLFAGLHFTADQAVVQDIYLGQLPATIQNRAISVPYYSQSVNYLSSADLFENSYFDSFASNATTISTNNSQETFYGPNLSGDHNVLNEVWKVAVSKNIVNVLPYPGHPASPYMASLAGRMMLDVRVQAKFATIASQLTNLNENGIRNCSVIIGTWQAYGYDNALPSQYPANASLGGDAQMKAIGSAAKAASCLFALHENYTDYYTNYSNYTSAATMQNPNGTQTLAWVNPQTYIRSYATKPGLFISNASTQSPEIHANYGTNASFIDVNSSAMPWWRADRDPKAQGNNSFGTYRDASTALWAYERGVENGPVFGEGKYHWFWSGLLDGVEAQFGSESTPITNGPQAPLFVDFDLTRIHPLQINYGMGYYNRWLPSAAMTTLTLDAYRMQEVIYGHAPYLADSLWQSVPRALLEQNLVSPTAARYALQTPANISYRVNGAWVDTSTAAKAGTFSLVQVNYPNGDSIVANSTPAAVSWGSLQIPQYGWAATGTNYLAYTAQIGGKVVDYSKTSQGIYANARNQADLLSESTVATPTVYSFKQTGARTFQIQMSWDVNTAVPGTSYQDFIHFVRNDVPAGSNALSGVVGGGLSAPTSSWSVGEKVVDKVLTYWLPSNMADGLYEVRVGLYSGAQRAPLFGNNDGNQRYTVGKIMIANQGKNISFTPVAINITNPDPRLNSAGSVVDFGTVRTDGMVTLRQITSTGGNTLQLSSYPRSRDVVVQFKTTSVAAPGSLTCDNGDVLTPAVTQGYWQVSLRGHKYCSWGGTL